MTEDKSPLDQILKILDDTLKEIFEEYLDTDDKDFRCLILDEVESEIERDEELYNYLEYPEGS